MDFPTSVRTCYQKYADFDGRASRSEFWFFRLYAFLLFACTSFLIPLSTAFGATSDMMIALVVLIALVFFFAAGIPLISVAVRRVHDTNAAGGWVLTWYIPYIGLLIFLVWGCIPGDRAENRFGPDPLLED